MVFRARGFRLDEKGLKTRHEYAVMTDRYAVIGNPVAHSRSPRIHARFAELTGEPIEYGALLAPIDGFVPCVLEFRGAGGRGANVTLPFKEHAFRLCDELTERAYSAQAVNTMVFEEDRVRGDNTDGCGLIRDLAENIGVSPAGKRVLLMGAGGAARGVLLPLLQERPAELTIVNRTQSRGEALAARYPGVQACDYGGLKGRQFDVVINATSAGLSDALPPLPPGMFAAGSLAYDMVYGIDTPFLRFARDAGSHSVSDGLGMLVEQAAESFFLWRGVRPPTKSVLDQMRKA